MQQNSGKIGFILFAVYLALYGGFVFVNAFSPTTMEATPIAGVNLAILYGFGLIIAAFILALIYGFMAGSDDDDAEAEGGDK